MEPNKIFGSYNDLQNAINSFEKENRVQFWKRDAKTLKSAEHHSPNLFKRAPQQLHYYKLKYACIHGGQVFRPKKNTKKRVRNHQGTLKNDCGTHITVGLTTDGRFLIVKSMNNDHNHEIPSEELFKQLPKQRRLTNEDKQKVEMMMKLKVNKKLLQADLVKKSGNAILLKDLSNISTSSQNSNNSFEEIVQKLTAKYNCTVDFKTKDSKFNALFFQDPYMKKSFSLFPEILFMDGTYKLLNIRCPVYIMAIENSLGTTDVVGIGILTSEEIESITWMLEKFKERNSKWADVKVVVTDKCASERQAISEQLPNASKLICVFHALQIFRREITVGKLNITAMEVTTSLQHIQKLVYSRSEEQYSVLLEEMKDNVPNSVFEYFIKNWHNLRDEWVKGLTAKRGSFLNSTNNRLESLNSKLKSVISTYSTFDEFITKLFVLLNIKKTQFQNELSKMIFKVIYKGNKTEAEIKFYNYITPFAFKTIETNLKLVCSDNYNSTECTFVEEDNKVLCWTNNSNKYGVSEFTCDCYFFTSMKLPCKHVLSYRKHLGLELFHENLFSKRWTRNYLESNNDVTTNNNDTQDSLQILSENTLSVPIIVNQKSLTYHQKFKKSEAVCLNIATLCSEVSTEEFHKRINLLVEIQNKWQNHEHILLQSNDDHDIEKSITDDDNGRCIIEIEHDYSSSDISKFIENTKKQTYGNDDNDLQTLNKIINSIVEHEVENETVKQNQETTCEEVVIENVYSEINIKDISMPVPIKFRGKPKGHNLTTIGLPKKRLLLQSQDKKKKKKN